MASDNEEQFVEIGASTDFVDPLGVKDPTSLAADEDCDDLDFDVSIITHYLKRNS